MSRGWPFPRSAPPFVVADTNFRWCPPRAPDPYARVMYRPVRSWIEQLVPASLLAPVDAAQPETIGPRSWRDWVVDSVGFLLAGGFGAIILVEALHERGRPAVDPTGSRRCGLRLAGLPFLVVAATLATRRRAGLCPAGYLLGVRHLRRAARARLPRRASPRAAGAARRFAVDPVRSGLRALRRTRRCAVGGPAGHRAACSRPPRGACSSVPAASS